MDHQIRRLQDIWNIRSLVYFLESDRLHPFASLGVGFQDIKLPETGSESQVNAGLGLRWNILDNLDARASFNFYDGQEFGDLKRSLNLGLHYQLGRTYTDQIARPDPIDSDNDGVIDSQDVCLGTRGGVQVDVRGCAASVDTDDDGVLDKREFMTNTMLVIFKVIDELVLKEAKATTKALI